MKTLDPVLRRRLLLVAAGLVAALLLVLLWRPLVAWFGGPGAVPPRGAGLTSSAGGLEVVARLDPDPPAQARNVLWMQVKDAAGKPVAGATVKVTWDMPAMAGMSELKGDAAVDEPSSATYRARFDLPAPGSWSLITEVASGDRRAHLTYGLTVGTKGLVEKDAQGGAAPAASRLPDALVTSLSAAMEVYEKLRGALAADRLDEARRTAGLLGSALERARTAAQGLPPGFAQSLQEAEDHAGSLAAATDLSVARADFGDLSEPLLAIMAHDERLQAGWYVFRCPMEEGFQKWVQRSPTLENPYMGRKMLDCGSPDAFTERTSPPAAGGGETAYYTCPMHPSVREDHPGSCPVCGMTLAPVPREALQSGEVRIDDAARERIGLRTGKVVRAPLRVAIHALGKVTADETKLVDVTPRVKGYVKELRVGATGQRVTSGQVLFTLYSPELFAAEQEYLLAARSSAGAALAHDAEEKLRLWDVGEREIAALRSSGKPLENVPFRSPVSGYVLEKNVVQGAAVEAGQRLYRIAPLDDVWVDAEVFEGDLSRVKLGQEAAVTLPYLPGRTFAGKVAYVYPTLEGSTRTGRVRVVLKNADMALKPEMYADVTLLSDQGERLQVPAPAVIYTGPRRIVFVDEGGGRLVPHEVTLGARVQDAYEVLSGLSAGDTVVTSGNFLIAAESRIKSAASFWEGSGP